MTITLDRLDPENRRRVEKLRRDRPRRLAVLHQHASQWPDTIAQLDAMNRDTPADPRPIRAARGAAHTPTTEA